MATAAENLSRFQEIATRGLQDRLDPDKRARFDEAIKRGLIKLPETEQPIQQEAQRVPTRPISDTDAGDLDAPSPKGFPGAGVIEPLITLVTGAVAEPVAGLAGIAALLPGGQTPTEAIASTREALTVKPTTPAGQAGLRAVGEVLQPVGEALQQAETFLGNKAFEVTGSPALAAAAATIPTALLEVLGVAAGKGVVKQSQKAKKAAAQGQIAREITEAVPSIDQLKDTSRSVFKEIDNLNASLQPKAYRGLVNKLQVSARGLGVDPDVTPLASKALDKFINKLGESPTLTEVDNLRTIASNVAGSANKREAAIGTALINALDETLDKFGSTAFRGNVEDIGKRYKLARDLWGRARRSELLEEAFTKARLQGSGFENGVVIQFRSILNNKRTRRFFKPDEIQAMRKVVTGDKKQNLAKLIGRLGFSEGRATNIIGGALGVTAGATVGGPIGAVAVPLIGQVSRKLAQRMTVRGAEFADQVIRAGSNAKRITTAYLKNTPKAERSAQELSELLMRNDINLLDLPDTDLARRASQITTENRAALIGALAVSPEQERGQK